VAKVGVARAEGLEAADSAVGSAAAARAAGLAAEAREEGLGGVGLAAADLAAVRAAGLVAERAMEATGEGLEEAETAAARAAARAGLVVRRAKAGLASPPCAAGSRGSRSPARTAPSKIHRRHPRIGGYLPS